MKRPLGILMLDTAFERPVGDVGNAQSWPFPVLYKRVKGASARKVVSGQDGDLLDAFIAAGEELVAEGAVALTTSCGFLALRQTQLAERLPVPVATSSLLQIPSIAAMLPKGRRVGVITYDRASLTSRHFAEVGVHAVPPVAGLPKAGAFHGVIEGGEPYDAAALAEELARTVEDLLHHHGDIGALVFECTNLPPFSSRIARQFGLPVFDSLTLGRWLYSSQPGI
ncbi:aspartate/glutamate racemase family protein [Allorhizobium sp. BGMRC 0089]|uniref:aspartate/glutamate racemase family protein n=1 Tax=Allorhizobium sonneratiae TaxID=2934936 RepID=UPI0020341391|nr:aspartate/glutamate racemase family protein [Allorhizobium sonneratiae]MCM2292434.1 aspartate/glutamate racemase family protein [Allorhizobium sonneratiae]